MYPAVDLAWSVAVGLNTPAIRASGLAPHTSSCTCSFISRRRTSTRSSTPSPTPSSRNPWRPRGDLELGADVGLPAAVSLRHHDLERVRRLAGRSMFSSTTRRSASVCAGVLLEDADAARGCRPSRIWVMSTRGGFGCGMLGAAASGLGDDGVLDACRAFDLDAHGRARRRGSAAAPSRTRRPAGVPVAMMVPGSSVNAVDRCAISSQQLVIISLVLRVLSQVVVDPRADPEVVRIGDLVGGHQPWPDRAVRVPRLAHRHRRRRALPIAHRHVVDDRGSRRRPSGASSTLTLRQRVPITTPSSPS